MATKATKAEKASDIWEREFAKGTRNWAYWIRIISPYVNFLSVHPALTEEQRQVAVKEFFRRVSENIGDFLSSCAQESFEFASAFVVAVPERPAKPSAGFSGVII